VEVEVDTSRGLPSFIIVGLPDTAVQESRERVQAAIKNAGLVFPRQRLTVNLAPAALRKEGPAYDLPIALGALAASGQIRPEWLERTLSLGELSLDGSVRHVRGVLPMAALARQQGFARVFVPVEDAGEVALLDGLHRPPVARQEVRAELLPVGGGVAPEDLGQFDQPPVSTRRLIASEARSSDLRVRWVYSAVVVGDR